MSIFGIGVDGQAVTEESVHVAAGSGSVKVQQRDVKLK